MWRVRWMDYDQEVYEEFFESEKEALYFVDYTLAGYYYELEECVPW